MPRSDSLKKLTSVMGRFENVFDALRHLPAGDQRRVLEWVKDDQIAPVEAELTAAKQ
jgi:hypothetical protein